MAFATFKRRPAHQHWDDDTGKQPTSCTVLNMPCVPVWVSYVGPSCETTSPNRSWASVGRSGQSWQLLAGRLASWPAWPSQFGCSQYHWGACKTWKHVSLLSSPFNMAARCNDVCAWKKLCLHGITFPLPIEDRHTEGQAASAAWSLSAWQLITELFSTNKKCTLSWSSKLHALRQAACNMLLPVVAHRQLDSAGARTAGQSFSVLGNRCDLSSGRPWSTGRLALAQHSAVNRHLFRSFRRPRGGTPDKLIISCQSHPWTFQNGLTPMKALSGWIHRPAGRGGGSLRPSLLEHLQDARQPWWTALLRVTASER